MHASMSNIIPRTSLTQVQSLSPARSFLKLTKLYLSSGKDRKRHLRVQKVPLNTWRCRLVPPCVDVWVSISMVSGGPGPVFGTLDMVPYLGTRSNVMIIALATSIIIYEKAQKKFVELIHPISSIISMYMMMQFSSAVDGTT